MNGFLLDTNVISELVRSRPEVKVTAWIESIDEDLLYLSVLTLGEIRKGVAAVAPSSRRAALETWLQTELRSRFKGRILPVDEVVADRWGMIAGQAQAAGTAVPVIDGLLAATAITYDLTLVTRNTADVVVAPASVFNPWTS